jgi:identified by metaGeneAnnotator
MATLDSAFKTQNERQKMAATEKIEMRTCKTCGETKPLKTGFHKCYGKPNKHGVVKQYYGNYCKICKYQIYAIDITQTGIETKKAVEARRKAATHAMEAAIKAQEEARAVINLFESIKAAREACPILSFSLWTGDVPQRLGAW